MSDCDCENSAKAVAGARDRADQQRVLRIVLAINLVMFVGEFVAGLLADSAALLADSADNLGDAFVYALSLYVLYRSLRWRAGAAFVKGLIQLGFGLGVAAQVVLKSLHGAEPIGLVMMGVAATALIGNLTCFVLLMKHRGDDVNMRSVWLCSRNDVLGNLGVIVAGLAVAGTGRAWPDLVVGGIMAAVFLHTSFQVLRDGARAWRGAGSRNGSR
jgi:cation diffusion facilitator family transporter